MSYHSNNITAMQTASLMKRKKVHYSGSPFRDGLTSRNQSSMTVMGKKIHPVVADDTTPEMKPANDGDGCNSNLHSVPPLLETEVDGDNDDDTEQDVPPYTQNTTAITSRTRPLIQEIYRDQQSVLPLNPRLTLSAFRRPENTIRLTQADPTRTLEAEYDLHAPRKSGVLGHGAFSTVRLGVRRRDGLRVAVKSIAKHEALRSRRLRICGRTYLEEWEILRRMKHNPYVLNLLDVFESDEEIQLVTEFCAGGELFDAIQQKKRSRAALRRGQYTEAQAARITKQILLALIDLHAQGLVHRDVKPENILIVKNDEDLIHVKLCDFGMARVICTPSNGDGDVSPLTPGRTRSFSMVGSDYYMAPEVCFGGRYDTAIDIYSMGVTLYILLCGFPPVFSGEDSDEVIFPNSYWKDVSVDAKDLVGKMLEPEVSERLSARECLHHPWILRGGRSTEATATTSSTSCDDRVRLDLVRQQLYNTLAAASPPRKRPADDMLNTPTRKRRYERRASATLMALADLYRGVAKSPSVAAITAGTLGPSSPSSKDRKPSFKGTTTVAALSF